MALNQSLVGSRAAALTSTVTTADLEACGAAFGGSRADDGSVLVGLGRAAAVIGPVLLDPRLGANMMRLGQIAHAFRVVGPVTAGDVVLTTATIAAVTATDAGERLDLQVTSTTRDGVPVVDGLVGILLRGPRRRQHEAESPTVSTTGWSTVTTVVFDDAAVKHFCVAVGDHNPIAVDDDAARQAGLPGPIVPNGALVAAVWRALTPTPTAIAADYLRPALVGETLTIETRDDGRAFRMLNQVGVVVIDGSVGGAP